jgi:hypothetical protein
MPEPKSIVRRLGKDHKKTIPPRDHPRAGCYRHMMEFDAGLKRGNEANAPPIREMSGSRATFAFHCRK